MPLADALPIAKQIADALEAAHDQGIIHRDLKPANIKVRPDGTVKVLDFGLAKAMDPAGASAVKATNSPTLTAHATALGMIMGTAAYMAPEQARGKAVDKRADIWAFGVVLYEMLTGRRAFEGGDISEVLASVLKDAPSNEALPAATPMAIRRLLRRCLEKDPAKRLDSMAAARLEIDDALAGGADASGVSPDGATRRWNNRTLAAAALAAVALLSAGAGLGWRLTPAPLVERPIARFAMAMPEGQLLGSFNAPSLAVAADGRRVVYRTTQAIFVRDLEDPEPREVTRSPGSGVWISPDGEFVLFKTPSGLSRVPVSGGHPQQIVATPEVAGAEWGSDGTVIYSTGVSMARIPETGGTPQILLTSSKTTDFISFPQRLPGDRLLFTRWGGRDLAPVTVATDLDGSNERVVLQGHSGRYIAPGYLLYGSEGRLQAVLFDANRGEVLGAAILVPDTVFISDQTAWAQIAIGQGGTAAYVSSLSTANQTQLAWADEGGRTTTALDVPRVYSDVRLAPDGRRVALHLWDEENDVWVGDLVRGTLTRVTFTAGEEETPVWSPDGRELAYAAERTGALRALVRRASDGGASAAERTIWQHADHFHVNDWSPDGRTIIVEVRRADTGNDLLAIDVATGTERPLVVSSFRERHGKVSPDGRWLAYTSDESGRDEVYVQPFPSLEGRVTVSTTGGHEPAWSRDGKRLFFRGAGQMMAASLISLSPIEFSAPVALFRDTFVRAQGDTHTHFDVDAAGRFLLINERDQGMVRERGQIHVVLNWAEQLRKLTTPSR